MPGIVGIIGTGPMEENNARLRCMIDPMMHEPFYTSGTYINESLKLCIGWVCHPDSFADCMPVWNETKDVCLIFSGEDFSEQAEIERLRAKGHACDSKNASYLVHLYEEFGTLFLEKLNGWFSGVLIDLRESKIVLFNDRYGLQRIYYHEHAAGFYFSSEAKSLLKALPELRQLDFSSLGETFSCGCALENRTLFAKVALLPGGSMWTFTGKHNIRKDCYFNPEQWERQEVLSGGEYYERLKETFARILPKYFQGTRQVAMSLTGGLDGRMMMAWAGFPPGTLPCYTFNGTYRDCSDVKIARRVARLCRQFHETIVVDAQFFAEFPDLAAKTVYVSDGTMDVIGSVELYVNRIARGIAPIRLTGNYGSEIVRGNVAFRPGSFENKLLAPEFSQLVQTAATTYSRVRQGHPVSFIAFKQVPWHHYSRFSVEQSQLTLRSPYLDNDLVALIYQAPPNSVLSQIPALRLVADGNMRLTHIPTDRGLLYRPTPVISKCRHLYQEFTAKAEYAYDYGMPQWLAGIDHMLAPLHPERLFLGRHKFCHFRVWYRDSLSRYLKDILLDSRTLSRPYLNARFLTEMVNSHIEGKRNYTPEIHRVLTAELLQRQLIEWR
jgi:asparagine synthase (glutamine-hydrolysing)